MARFWDDEQSPSDTEEPYLAMSDMLNMLVCNFNDLTSIEKMHGFSVPEESGPKSAYFQWAMSLGKHMFFMSLYIELIGHPPTKEEWNEAVRKIEIINRFGKN